MEQAQSIRKQFIEQFVLAIIEEKRKQQRFTRHELLVQTRPLQEEIPEFTNPLTAEIPAPIKKQVVPSPSQKTPPRTPLPKMPQRPSMPQFHLPPQRPLARPVRRPLPQFHQRPPPAPPKPTIPQALAPPPKAQPLKIESFKKINALLADPSIEGIECPGPGLPVTITRGGVVQNTPINFSPEELTAVMEEVSEKTRIPYGAGIFKAALGETIMTAIMSEYAGTRFIIQRKK